MPYSESETGLPECCIRHSKKPTRDLLNWDAHYKHVKVIVNSGFVLSPHIMGKTEVWNHPALFDYMDGWRTLTNGFEILQSMTQFTQNMYETYRTNYPPI